MTPLQFHSCYRPFLDFQIFSNTKFGPSSRGKIESLLWNWQMHFQKQFCFRDLRRWVSSQEWVTLSCAFGFDHPSCHFPLLVTLISVYVWSLIFLSDIFHFLSPAEVLHDKRSELEMKHVKLHKQQICNSQQQLDQEMQRVLDLEGEGKGANKISSKFFQKKGYWLRLPSQWHSLTNTMLTPWKIALKSGRV